VYLLHPLREREIATIACALDLVGDNPDKNEGVFLARAPKNFQDRFES
jgi:hypothetical protein